MTNNLSLRQIFIWAIIFIIALISFGAIALARGESINSIWLITAAICTYLLFYRFYSAFIATKILLINPHHQTPAFKLRNGHDYEPTNRWILFGHHFAAIAGPGPLIGPTLAAQFGYLPGMLWILIGAVLGGCVQDMVILFFSTRRNGKSLCQIAKDELGIIGAIAANISALLIMVILIGVLALIIVNAMKHSPWASSTVFATIPIAILIGLYLRFIRPGAVLEASIIGFILLILAVIGGKYIQASPILAPFFNREPLELAWLIMIYGFSAAVLPVWLLLAPRDYLSSFLKLGVIILLALAVIIINPPLQMPALTRFIDGSGPIFSGKIFPFMFITIACGAISGFHALIASGTTPKLLSSEKDIRMIGYGAMALESFVALMALIAATIMEPGIFFAINSPIAAVGEDTAQIISTINNWGFALNLEQMQQLSAKIGETTLFHRTGGAPSLAVGMAKIFDAAFGDNLLSIWYHFIIMFEAVFILTTLDAGTRVARFMIQDVIGHFNKSLIDNNSHLWVIFTSFLAVAAWGYFLYAGVIDPNGGINMLWPLFGMANQILAAIALNIATCIILKSKQAKYFWVSALPMIWLMIVTLSAAWQKLTSPDPKIGILAAAQNIKYQLTNNLLPADKIAIAPQLIFNQYVVAALTGFFALMLIVITVDMIITAYKDQRAHQ